MNRSLTDHGNIEPEILIRFRQLDDPQWPTIRQGRCSFHDGISPFHGFQGKASAIREDDALSQVEPAQLASNLVAVIQIAFLVFGWSAPGQHSGGRQQRPQKERRVDQVDTLVFKHLRDRANQ